MSNRVYSLSKRINQWQRDEAYIDFNGEVTDSLIYRWESASGYDRISQKLINLLKRHDANALVPLKTERYPEYSQQNVKNHYKELIQTEINVKKVWEFDIPLWGNQSADFLVYQVHLPLWYIVQELINTHDRWNNHDYSKLTSKELTMVFHDYEQQKAKQGIDNRFHGISLFFRRNSI